MHQTTMAARAIQYYYFVPAYNVYCPHPNDLLRQEYDPVTAQTTYVDDDGYRHLYPVIGNSYTLNDDRATYTLVALPSDLRALNQQGYQNNPYRDQQDDQQDSDSDNQDGDGHRNRRDNQDGNGHRNQRDNQDGNGHRNQQDNQDGNGHRNQRDNQDGNGHRNQRDNQDGDGHRNQQDNQDRNGHRNQQDNQDGNRHRNHQDNQDRNGYGNQQNNQNGIGHRHQQNNQDNYGNRNQPNNFNNNNFRNYQDNQNFRYKRPIPRGTPKIDKYDGTQSRRSWLAQVRVQAEMTEQLDESDEATRHLQSWFTLYLTHSIHQTQVKKIFRDLKSSRGQFTWQDFEEAWLATDSSENYPTERAKFLAFKFNKKKHGNISDYYLHLMAMVERVNMLAPADSVLSDRDQKNCFEKGLKSFSSSLYRDLRASTLSSLEKSLKKAKLLETAMIEEGMTPSADEDSDSDVDATTNSIRPYQGSRQTNGRDDRRNNRKRHKDNQGNNSSNNQNSNQGNNSSNNQNSNQGNNSNNNQNSNQGNNSSNNGNQNNNQGNGNNNNQNSNQGNYNGNNQNSNQGSSNGSNQNSNQGNSNNNGSRNNSQNSSNNSSRYNSQNSNNNGSRNNGPNSNRGNNSDNQNNLASPRERFQLTCWHCKKVHNDGECPACNHCGKDYHQRCDASTDEREKHKKKVRARKIRGSCANHETWGHDGKECKAMCRKNSAHSNEKFLECDCSPKRLNV